MMPYNFQDDLTEVRHSSVRNILLLSTLLLGVTVPWLPRIDTPFVIALPAIIGVGGGWLAWYAKRPTLAAWVYLLALTATCTLVILMLGITPVAPFLYLLPIMLAIILVHEQNIARFAAFNAVVMLAVLFTQSNFFTTVTNAALPLVFMALIIFTHYYMRRNLLRFVEWAADVQTKEERRAAMYYEQKEQFGASLLEVQKLNSVLDLTNRKLAAAEQDAQRANKAKSVFLSNVSHELRAPLNVIIGYSNSILTQPEMYKNIGLPDAYRTPIKFVEENGNYLLSLINDLLDMSKIEAGKLDLNLEATSLHDVFRAVIATSLGLIKNKPVQIRQDFASDLPMVHADAIRVRQVLLNLMSNAIKFTPNGTVTLSARVDDEYIHIAVKDSGIGIPQDKLASIFERFQQADKDTHKTYGGTGLGLDIARQLALLHGSDLTVTSEVGKGSTFSFQLPLAQYNGHDAPTLTRSPASGIAFFEQSAFDDAIPMTVLVLEDDVHRRDALLTAIEDDGNVGIAASRIDEAFEFATTLIPSAMLIDHDFVLSMGDDFIQRIQQDEMLREIPLVLYGRQVPAHTANGQFIAEPIDTAEIMALIRTMQPLRVTQSMEAV
jgi:signal transduction histidine kinase